MTAATLVVDGVSIRLGKRIGRGGEGEVFALENDGDRALKIYTSSDIQQREAKITAIVNRKIAQQSSLVAFPLAIARHSDGRFAGFVMKRVQGHKPLFELYSPGARKKHFPKADFRFLIRAAANVSRAVSSVHRTGCVIGDINHSGIMISDEARVALIDADSFQFIDGPQAFLCRVGVPEYTPPELQGKKLSGIVRTANHDAFGLAVVIFQLLFMGRHPFVGAFAKGDMPIERAIFEHRFVYSLKREVGMTRPPGAASLADFPSDVAEAFEQAFSPEPGAQRPSAETWAEILEGLERSLAICAKDNLHVYPIAAAECPWCRMENKLGMLLFLPALLNFGLPTDDPGSALFNLAAIWAAIEKVQVPDPKTLQPTLPLIDCDPSEQALREKRKFTQSRIAGSACLFLTLLGLIFAPKFWLLLATLGAYGVKKCMYKMDSANYFVDRYFSAREQFELSIQKWRTKCGITQITILKTTLAGAKSQYENLEREKHMRVSMYQANHSKRQAIQMEKWLESHEIRKAKIRHIGLARQTALASYGIETALDITEEKVLSVPGFGLNNSVPLLEWRKGLEESFQYDPNSNDLDAEELQKIAFDIESKGSDLRKKLASGAMDLAQAAHAVTMQFKREDPAIAHAYAQYKQEREDLVALGLEPPKFRQPPRFESMTGGSNTGWNPSGLSAFASKVKAPGSGFAGLFRRPVTGRTSIAPTGPMQSAPGFPPAPTSSNRRRGKAAQRSNRYADANQSVAFTIQGQSANSQYAQSTNSQNARPAQPQYAQAATPVYANSPCPKCGAAMAQRVSRKGTKAEKMFYGCSTYPSCNGVRLV